VFIPSRSSSTRPRLEALEDRTVPSTVTTLDDSGPGSLRDQISQAAFGDTIDFDPSLAGGTISLTSGPIAITGDLTIQGLGADSLTVSGNHTSNIFNESQDVNLTISDLTLANGSTSSAGGAVSALGSLTLTGVDLLGNTSGDNGGGVYFAPPDSASLTMDNCQVANNVALNGAGVDAVPPSDFAGDVSVSIADCTIQNNRTTTAAGRAAGFGCGLNASFQIDDSSSSGELTIADSTFMGNTGNTSGRSVHGAGLSVMISTESDGATATALLSGLTIANNTGNLGGGLYLFADQSSGGTASAVVENCTITNNVAQGAPAGSGLGGGIEVYANQPLGAIISFCTIVDNRATQGEGLSPAGGGIYQGTNTRPLYTLDSSIVALNEGAADPDVDGPIHSLGYNVIGTGGRSTGWDPATDQVGDYFNPIDPQLGPLGNYGGPTMTMPPLAWSLALDAGDPNTMPATDQRGVPRSEDVNSGAFQASGAWLTVTAPDTVVVGQSFDVTVAVYDIYGQAAVGYTGVVDLLSSDPNASYLGTHAFSSDDASSFTFNVTLSTPGLVDLTANDGDLMATTTVNVLGGGDGGPGALGGHHH
jgi:hypothetical protein